MQGVVASTTIGPELDWRLAVAVGVLTALAVAASWIGRLGTALPSVRAVARAILQLLVVALVVTAALEHVWSSLLFVAFMFGVATFTASGRVDARSSTHWIAASIGAGAVPVLLVVFGLGAAPFEPPTIVAICGIVIGNAMTGFTLMGRRSLAALRERFGEVEAALSLGFYLSMSGVATFKKADALREIFAAAPLDRILVETDAPFLAPPPHRGKRNEPAYVARTAAVGAGLFDLEPEVFARRTTENFHRLFAKAASALDQAGRAA